MACAGMVLVSLLVSDTPDNSVTSDHYFGALFRL